MKLLEEPYENILGKFVRVDSVILPPWAPNKHYFMYMNALALEQPRIRNDLHNWIDLIFGEKQQKEEYFNMFKSLTSEVIVLENIL